MPPLSEDPKEPPCHVAIVMDGNGRWAKARGLPRAEGHRRGAEAARRAVQSASELGVRYLTRAGYDPLAMASFLDQLGAQSQLSQKLAFQDGAPDPADNWLVSHPRTEDRVVAAGNERIRGRIQRCATRCPRTAGR